MDTAKLSDHQQSVLQHVLERSTNPITYDLLAAVVIGTNKGMRSLPKIAAARGSVPQAASSGDSK